MKPKPSQKNIDKRSIGFAFVLIFALVFSSCVQAKSIMINIADGITLDNRGNLYLSGNGVTVFNPKLKTN